jgi:hypothetical protein
MSGAQTLTVTDATGTYQVEVTVAPQADGKVGCTALTVRQLPGGPLITSDHLRRVPVYEIVHRALASHGDAPRIPELTAEEAQRLRSGGPTDEALQHVAAVYRAALATASPPTAAVEASLGLPRSTVGTWVRLARARGHLGPSKGRGRAAG